MALAQENHKFARDGTSNLASAGKPGDTRAFVGPWDIMVNPSGVVGYECLSVVSLLIHNFPSEFRRHC